MGVTLPSSFVKEKKLKAGQKIYVHADPEYDMIFIRTTKKAISSITPEFKMWLDNFTEKHSSVLQELAKR